jgi:hypothetical protein
MATVREAWTPMMFSIIGFGLGEATRALFNAAKAMSSCGDNDLAGAVYTLNYPARLIKAMSHIGTRQYHSTNGTLPSF